MKIIKHLGLYEATEESNYTPTPEELLYWYKGTHTSYGPNPYTPKKTSVTKISYKLARPSPSVSGK